MERSKGLILIVVGLAAALIVWQVGFKKSETPKPSSDKKEVSDTSAQPRQPRQPRQPTAENASPENQTQPTRLSPNTLPAEANFADRAQARGYYG